MTTPALLTADDLWRLQPSDQQTELVRGVMVVCEPPGFRHGDIVTAISARLYTYVMTNRLGRVLSGDAGFILFTDPDTVRGPDIAFVRRDRVPDPVPWGFARFAPDLAVEVLSPDDRPGKVLEKVADYLNAGTQVVWIIDPDRRQARVHRADGTVSVIDDTDSLDGEDVVPGFVCGLAEIL